MQIVISLLAYIVVIGVLVTAHEFGHFIVARGLGIKVLRFSIGFGRPLYTWHRKGDDTEYVLAAIPLGGYVKMLDEREGEVAARELPRAFNRQHLWRRYAVVLAGPVFNLLFAVLAYWIVFMAGIPGIKPVVGDIATGSPAAAAGFEYRDEITAVDGALTGSWDAVQLDLFQAVLNRHQVRVDVRTPGGQARTLTLTIADDAKLTEPGMLLQGLGLSQWDPLPPVVWRVTPGGSAASSGVMAGDRFVSVEGVPVLTWQSLVRIIKASPNKTIDVVVERAGRDQLLKLHVGSVASPGGNVGQMGIYVQAPPAHFYDNLTIEERYNPPAALWQGLARTADMSWLTLDAAWNMLLGRVSWHNISGPVDIAQYAGYAAESGLVVFLDFLAFVSISLGVLNLLPIPVLDGGHLLYFTVEAVKGSPLSERAEALGLRVGITLLMLLVGFAIYNDLVRVFS